MNPFKNIVVTDIQPPIIVHCEKGMKFSMTDRSTFGLSLCTGGQITYAMNGKTYISNSSNAIILPQGSTYSLIGNKEGLFPVINFSCKNFACDEILVLPLNNPQLCIKYVEILKNLFLYKENHFKIYSIFYELLEKIFSFKIQNGNILSPVIKMIEENIQDPNLSNEKLAKKVGISEVYLRKLFASKYQTSPKQYILDIRIRKAKQMLVGTPFTITAIAKECGFASIYHFCRTFKNRAGLTPTEYATKNSTYRI